MCIQLRQIYQQQGINIIEWNITRGYNDNRTGGQIRITSVHIKGTVTADPLNLLSDQYE